MRRYAAYQFSFAALDAVHAGIRILRAGEHESRLRARHQRKLPFLFVWRCVPSLSTKSTIPSRNIILRLLLLGRGENLPGLAGFHYLTQMEKASLLRNPCCLLHRMGDNDDGELLLQLVD